ncbi:TOBE domain-containing protein, partial [Thermodesulfobacteriota bacterium]
IRNVWSGELVANGADLMQFNTGDVSFAILTGSDPGPGFVTVRSEDVTVANERTVTSALNTFEGAISDVAQARLGFEVTVDIGVDVTALVTEISRLGLEHGKKVWVSFKASAARFIQA